MRRVTYAGETFVTTDDMAAALVEFAAELALDDRSQPVSVPAMTQAGEARVDLVVGPASEIISVPDEWTKEIDAGTAPDELRARAQRLAEAREPHRGHPIEEDPAQLDLDY